MHCEQAEMLIPQFIYNELSAEDTSLVSAHLATCASCTQSCKELKEASSFLESALKAPSEKQFSEEKRQQLLTAFSELKPVVEPIELAEAKKEIKKKSRFDAKTFFTSIAAILLLMVGLSGLLPLRIVVKENKKSTKDVIVAMELMEVLPEEKYEESSALTRSDGDRNIGRLSNDSTVAEHDARAGKSEYLKIQKGLSAYKSTTGEYPQDYVVSEEAVDKPTGKRVGRNAKPFPETGHSSGLEIKDMNWETPKAKSDSNALTREKNKNLSKDELALLNQGGVPAFGKKSKKPAGPAEQKELGNRALGFDDKVKDTEIIGVGGGTTPSNKNLYTEKPKAKWGEKPNNTPSSQNRTASEGEMQLVENNKLDMEWEKDMDGDKSGVTIIRRKGMAPDLKQLEDGEYYIGPEITAKKDFKQKHQENNGNVQGQYPNYPEHIEKENEEKSPTQMPSSAKVEKENDKYFKITKSEIVKKAIEQLPISKFEDQASVYDSFVVVNARSHSNDVDLKNDIYADNDHPMEKPGVVVHQGGSGVSKNSNLAPLTKDQLGGVSVWKDKKDTESAKDKEIEMLKAELAGMQEQGNLNSEVLNKLKSLVGKEPSTNTKKAKRAAKNFKSSPQINNEEVTDHNETENTLERQVAEGAEESTSDMPQVGSGLQGGIGGGKKESVTSKKRVELKKFVEARDAVVEEKSIEHEVMIKLNEKADKLSVKEEERRKLDRTPLIEDKMTHAAKRPSEERNLSTKISQDEKQLELNKQQQIAEIKKAQDAVSKLYRSKTLQTEPKLQNESLKKKNKESKAQEDIVARSVIPASKTEQSKESQKDMAGLPLIDRVISEEELGSSYTWVNGEKTPIIKKVIEAELHDSVSRDQAGTALKPSNVDFAIEDSSKKSRDGAGYLSDVRRLDDYDARGVIAKSKEVSKHIPEIEEASASIGEYEIAFQDTITYPAEWEDFINLRKPDNGIEKEREQWKTAILQKLEKPIFFDFTKKGFREGLNELSDLTGVTIAFDKKLFTEKGIDPEVPIQMVANGMSAKNALKWILANVGADYSLANQAIVIRAKDQVVGETKMSTYSVLDLIDPPKSFAGPDITPEGKALKTDPKEVDLHNKLNLDENNLKELIMEKIARDTWDETKGTSVEVFQGKLVIVHSEEVQDQVAAFLEELRESAAKAEAEIVKEEVVDVVPIKEEPKKITINPFVNTTADSLSTFSIDTDSASYYVCRQSLVSGVMPHESVVRPEEFINAFDYNYCLTGAKTFAINSDCMQNPLNPNTHILKVGIKGKVLGRDGRKPVHVVLVVDTSGSMAKESRLPMVKKGIEKLVTNMQAGDRVSLVTYGSDVTLNLEYVPVEDIDQIQSAVEALKTGGSTDLAKGVMVGYQIAATHFKKGSMNQVMICSDGVANVGHLEADKIIKKVEAFKKQGVSFTSIGFGSGDYNDQLLVKLALRGDGFYYYVNSEEDLKRVFENEIGASFSVIAKDVKLQVAFKENRVLRYRLIGYEAREVKDKDFRNNAVDGGEIISGKSVTAIYELELAKAASAKEFQESLGTVTVRFQNIENGRWEEDAVAITGKIQALGSPRENPYFYLAYCAATFAEIMRKSPYVKPTAIGQIEGYVRKISEELVLNDQAKDLLKCIQAYEKLMVKDK